MPDVYINPSEIKKIAPAKKSIGFNIHPSPEMREKFKGHTHNPFAAYCYFPHKIDFLNKEPDEKVILLVRRHIITNVPWIALVVLMIFAPLILNTFPLLDFLPLRFQTVAILSWYLLVIAIAIQGFLSWFFSVNIVTNKRVIDIDFENLIYRKITDAKLDNIEDVTVKMGSVIRTLLDFGDVQIQTAAEIPEVIFWAVPYPDKVDKLLSDLRLEIHQ